MPSHSDEFISLSQAAKDYPTSRRTIERRRLKAQKKGDQDTLKAFMIRTKDGEEYRSPSVELSHKLVSEGQQPEAFVSVDWMERHFPKEERQSDDDTRHADAAGRHTSGTDGRGVTQHDAPTSDPLVNALLDQLEKKDEQLQTQSELIKALTERQRESNILLSQFQQRLPENAPNPFEQQVVVDTTPKPEPVTQKPRTTSTTRKKTKTTKQGTTKAKEKKATTKPKQEKEPANATASKSPDRFSWLPFRKK